MTTIRPRTFAAAALVLVLPLLSRAQGPQAVAVWEGTVSLPTSVEEAPNPNPPFDLFPHTRVNYPYPLRDRLTGQKRVERFRALFLENEYLRLTVLPELGGHVYSCVDKISGQDMFYANETLKKALIGYRGAWAAFGVEFNFPVSHSWVSLSPVDSAWAAHPDGSGSIWVGNIDAVYGSSWRVELRMRPRQAVLEQQVTLHNRSDVRHRYYWWTNAAVRAWDDSRLVYPTELMATHGFTRVVPWPVDEKGHDLSVIGNQVDGPVSLFTHGTREPFVGVYHPRVSFGTVHLADPAEMPTHKVWSWGADAEAHRWRQALSDDNSAYVELQAGLFRNQETYGFLEPQETIRFSERWLPVRDIGGITRANGEAVLHATRPAPSRLRIGLNVTRPPRALRFSVAQGDRVVADALLEASARLAWSREISGLAADEPWRIVVSDGDRVLLEHTEGKFDVTPRGSHPGRRDDPGPPAGDDALAVLARGTELERQGERIAAFRLYRKAARTSNNPAMGKAAGRLAVSLHWAEAGAPFWRRHVWQDVVDWLKDDAAGVDPETQYYLGLAAAAIPRSTPRHSFEAAARRRSTRSAALLQLARLDAREQKLDEALQHLDALIDVEPQSIVGGALGGVVLRRLGRLDLARERVNQWLAVDPTSSMLRYERTRLGTPDDALWRHLSADPNRVLDLVDQYLAIGALDDCADLLERTYPPVDEPAREPGTIAPGDHALVAYYRAYVRSLRGQPAADAFREASRARLDWVFPHRASTYAVLDTALEVAPNDATALFLRGSLLLASDLAALAIQDWRRALTLRPGIPTLHRNLGLALLHTGGDVAGALAVLNDGLSHEAANVEIYLALDQVLSLTNAPPADRVTALRRYPDERAPSVLAYKLALALAEQGAHDAAEAVLRAGFFAREEGGTSVRAVYAQIRLERAADAAERKACSEALAVVDALETAVPGVDFTAGGLADVLRQPFLQLQRGVVERACGRLAQGTERLRRLAGAGTADANPVAMALAYRAARALGDDTSAWTDRLRAAASRAQKTIASSESVSPVMHLAHGTLLEALGDDEAARRAFDAALLLPDRNLSHHHVRAARRALTRPAQP